MPVLNLIKVLEYEYTIIVNLNMSIYKDVYGERLRNDKTY